VTSATEAARRSRRRGDRGPGAAAFVTLAAALAIAQPAPAQDAPPCPATLVEEVEVIAHLPGPALWRVSTPTSQLWIVVRPGRLPKDFQWDNRRVATALHGARELVLPPVATGGLGDVFDLLVDPGHVLHLPPGETVRGGLPPALAERWEAAARAIDQNPARYDHWRPVLGALMLVSDAQRRDPCNPAGNQAPIFDLARSLHVKLRPLANYKATGALRALAAASPEAATACVALAAQTVERLPVDGPRRAAAWSTGDLQALKAIGNGASMGACLDAVPATAALRNREAADWAKELGKALAAPGKTVVAVDLDNLTREGGLLDQLKAQGLEVIGPAYCRGPRATKKGGPLEPPFVVWSVPWPIFRRRSSAARRADGLRGR